MVRRSTSLLVGLFMSTALLAGPPAGAATPAASAATSTDATAAKVAKKPAKPTRKCRVRQTKPRKKVASKRFATCVVRAMAKGKTARLDNRFDDGSWNKGPARFRKNLTEASARYSNGSRLVIKGKKAWLKSRGRPWVQARKNGTPEEQLAHTIQTLWTGLSSRAAYKRYLKSSTSGWKWTGKTRKINGVRAKEYTGTPKLLGYSFDRYAVWLDKWDRPVRIASRLTVQGITSSGVQNLSKWGKPVTIKAPRI